MVTMTTVAGAQSQVTSRSDIPNATTVTWSGLGPASTYVTTPDTMPSVVGNITVSTESGWAYRADAGSAWGGGFAVGDNVLYMHSDNSVTLTFANPITGFATQLWNNYAGRYPQSISIFQGAVLIANYTMDGAGGNAPNNNQAAVLGAMFDGGFDTVVLSSMGGNFGINQLTVSGTPNTSTVPEPSSMALLGTGLVGLVPMVRRRLAR